MSVSICFFYCFWSMNTVNRSQKLFKEEPQSRDSLLIHVPVITITSLILLVHTRQTKALQFITMKIKKDNIKKETHFPYLFDQSSTSYRFLFLSQHMSGFFFFCHKPGPVSPITPATAPCTEAGVLWLHDWLMVLAPFGACHPCSLSYFQPNLIKAKPQP